MSTILVDCGYTLVCQAKRDPVWKDGRIVANNGPIDLLKGAVDSVFISMGKPTLFVQVCHRGGESPRRAKLRSVGLDPRFHEGLLAAFDLDRQEFRLFRAVEDYAEKGWRAKVGDKSLPWEAATRQVPL